MTGEMVEAEGTSLDDARERMLEVLGRLEEPWLKKALGGEVAAAQVLLEIEKQRSALLGLAPAGAAVRIAAGATTGKGDGQGGGGEVKVVVEYVQDWREARRQRGEG